MRSRRHIRAWSCSGPLSRPSRHLHPLGGSAVLGPAQVARIRLLRASWVSSARPSSLQQRREVHAEPAAVALAQAVPAADRVVRRASPRLDGSRRGRLLLVGGAERHPVALLGQPGVQVVDRLQPVLQRGRADLADERGRVGLLRPCTSCTPTCRAPSLSSHGSSLVPALIAPSPLAICGQEVGEQRLPAERLRSRHSSARSPEPFPAAVLDLDPGGGLALREEPDLDLGRVGPVGAQVPQVGQAAWAVSRRSPRPSRARRRPRCARRSGRRRRPAARRDRPARSRCGRAATRRRSVRSTR